MLDDFDDLDTGSFLEDLEGESAATTSASSAPALLDDFEDEASFSENTAASPKSRRSKRERRILGMNATQRFVISILLFSTTCLLGFFFLLITERIYPPFLY